MSANQADFLIAAMARVLGVSEPGYHAWRTRPPSAHANEDKMLLKRVRTVHASSRETYGSPRVPAELRADGERHGRKRIAPLMRGAGLTGASRRRKGVTTTHRDQEARPAPDLVDRDFTAAGPNRLWVTDITFVPTTNGFMYLAVVLDAWSRRIVGWSMANHVHTELVLDALDMAIGQRRPANVIHHSDQGSTRHWSLADVVWERACAPPWAWWATLTTTTCAKAFSRRWSANCWSTAGSHLKPRQRWPASASLKGGTNLSDSIPHWVADHRWLTKQRWRTPSRKRNHPENQTLHKSGAASICDRAGLTGEVIVGGRGGHATYHPPRASLWRSPQGYRI